MPIAYQPHGASLHAERPPAASDMPLISAVQHNPVNRMTIYTGSKQPGRAVSTTSSVIALIAVAGAAAVGFAIFKAKLAAQASAKGEVGARFKAKPLLTPNELEFLGRLEVAMPELSFCPQVAMGVLLDPAVSRKDGKAYFRLRGMFAQKIVDFVAQNRRDGMVVAVIELDDRSHDDDKDAKRDAMLGSAGYRTVRWNSKSKPDAATIRATLMPASPPTEVLRRAVAKA